MAKKSDKIKQISVSDHIDVAILNELEILNGVGNSGGGGLAGGVLPHSAVSYTDALPHNTTSGKNTVMITCVTGVEDIAGIVRPAGVYTFQPTLNNTVAVIVVNANSGEVIIDEL